MSNIIQFKRNLTFDGSYEDAREAVNNVGLLAGEPLLVSYVSGEYTKYFVSIGVGNDSIITLPTYDTIDDLNDHINDLVNNILDIYSSKWISVDNIDTERSNVSFTKDEDTGLVVVKYEGSAEGTVADATDISTSINDTTITQQDLNEILYDSIQWWDIKN